MARGQERHDIFHQLSKKANLLSIVLAAERMFKLACQGGSVKLSPKASNCQKRVPKDRHDFGTNVVSTHKAAISDKNIALSKA